MRKRLLVFAAIVSFSTVLFAQEPDWAPAPGHTTLTLWPHGAPGKQANPALKESTATAKDRTVAGRSFVRVTNVSSPTITLYKANGENSGAAVVVFPGGAYRTLAMGLEGTEVCDWLNSIHVNCILLKYRVPNSGPYPKSGAALEDAQRAVGMVRQHAAEWHIDANRIGVLGFSAGAHLAVALGTHLDQRIYDPVDAADQMSCRPDFAVIIYPGYLAVAEQNMAPNAAIHVTDKTPTSFILQAEDDPVHVENSLVYFKELKDAKVPAEMHLYAQGGHGYGLRTTELPISHWPGLVETWLHTIGILPGAAK